MICKYFTGSISGHCKAGIAFDLVRDQSRHDLPALYPCQGSADCFTTCECYEPDRRFEELLARYNTQIKLTGFKERDIVLLSISGDRKRAFGET